MAVVQPSAVKALVCMAGTPDINGPNRRAIRRCLWLFSVKVRRVRKEWVSPFFLLLLAQNHLLSIPLFRYLLPVPIPEWVTVWVRGSSIAEMWLVPLFYASSARIRLTISMAPWAQSAPLLPALVPARSMACSMVSVVRTPNMTGMSLFRATLATPLDTSLHT